MVRTIIGGSVTVVFVGSGALVVVLGTLGSTTSGIVEAMVEVENTVVAGATVEVVVLAEVRVAVTVVSGWRHPIKSIRMSGSPCQVSGRTRTNFVSIGGEII